MSRRTERIGEQIRGEVARLLREEVTDPRIGLVTLVRVDVAPDLSNARVFWSAVDDRKGAELERAAQGLASASSYMRKQLSRALPTRRVPELRFEHDPSLAEGSKMLSLIAEMEHKAKESNDDEGSADGG